MVDTSSVVRAAARLEEFSFAFPDGTRALEKINLEVHEGESLAILGANGAGKSTLLLSLAGLVHGTGQIFLLDEKLTPANARQLRRRIGFVFQDPDDQLFMPTLAEDVAFGPLNLSLAPAEVENRVQAALEQVHLGEKRQRPPHHLSYGEKRRAALATALAMQPDILLLDEPTSNLDPATRQEIIAYLKSLSATRILATHDLDLAAKLCDRCALLSAGKLIALASSTEILNDSDLLKAHRLMPR